MSDSNEWLGSLAKKMKDDSESGAANSPDRVTVKELLRRFGTTRRGRYINNYIRNRMEELQLRTVPDFEQVYIDSTISIELASGAVDIPSPDDPTHRIGLLDAANRKPVSVNPTDRLEVATTIMLLNDFSQLPVMPNERDVKGVISWKSIGVSASVGGPREDVRHCMDSSVREISIDSPLVDANEDIAKHGYILVRGEDRTITGIVTASDLADQFKQIAEPFLIVGEIEGHLRMLIHRKFTVDEMTKASSSSAGEQPIGGSADLTLGAYCRLLEPPEHWERLGLHIDRKSFVKRLDYIREIRNDVMHFNPDGLAHEDLMKLRNFAGVFRDLGYRA